MKTTTYTCPYFKVTEEDIILPNGNPKRQIRIEHPGAVVILPVCDNGDILLIHQYRAVINDYIWELPAGSLEFGEDPLECAKREIQEETGFKADKWLFLGNQYPLPGNSNEIQYLYLAEELTTNKKDGDADEIITVHRKSVQEIEEMIKIGEFNDAKSLSTLMIWKTTVLRER